MLDPDYYPNKYVPNNEEAPPTLFNNLVPAPEVEKTKGEGEEEDNTTTDQTTEDKKKEDRYKLTQERKRSLEETDGYASDSDYDDDEFLIYYETFFRLFIHNLYKPTRILYKEFMKNVLQLMFES